MQKIRSEYTFDAEYTHQNNGAKQNVTVKLEIDYRSKTYTIKPSNGQNNFSFIDASHNWKMWKSVLEAINNAIDFANTELCK